MIFLLLAILIVLLIIAYFLGDHNILEPAFIFTLSITFGVLWACMYARKWELGLHLNTFLVISIGVMEFIIVCRLTHLSFINFRSEKGVYQNHFFNDKKISTAILVLIIVLILITIYFSVKEITSWADVPMSSLMEASRKVDNTKFLDGEQFRFSKVTDLCRLVVNACSYLFCFLFTNELLQKRINIFYGIIIFWGIICQALTGGRSEAINIILSIALFYLMNLYIQKNTNSFLSQKLLIELGILALVLIASFKGIGVIMQRSISDGTMDYLATYLGAEIKNLDIFLQEPRPKSIAFGSQTFVYLVIPIGKKLGIIHARYALDLPFRYVKGYNLGNVYTVFYPFIYDFGYKGLVILTAIMAMLSQLIFEAARDAKRIVWFVIFNMLYAKVATSLIFSFFSNKFFENNFTIAWVKQVVIWLILGFVFFRLFSREKKSVNICKSSGKKK